MKDNQFNAVRNIASEAEIEFIDLTDGIGQAIAEGQQPYLPYDTHFGPVGHEITGQVIADYMARSDL